MTVKMEPQKPQASTPPPPTTPQTQHQVDSITDKYYRLFRQDNESHVTILKETVFRLVAHS